MQGSAVAKKLYLVVDTEVPEGFYFDIHTNSFRKIKTLKDVLAEGTKNNDFNTAFRPSRPLSRSTGWAESC